MVSAVYQPIEQFAHIVEFPLSAHGRAGSHQRLLIFSDSEDTNFYAHWKAVSKHFLAACTAKKYLARNSLYQQQQRNILFQAGCNNYLCQQYSSYV